MADNDVVILEFSLLISPCGIFSPPPNVALSLDAEQK